MKKNPVIVFISGLALVVDAILGCFVIAGSLDAALATQIGLAQTALCGLVAATLRSQVDSPETVERLVAEALHRPQVPAFTEADDLKRHVSSVRKSVAARR